jgi:hypothetical protein
VDEATWLACTESQKMLAFLRGKVSERKLRLFACACCRRAWHLLEDQRSRQAVLIAEAHADGTVSPRALRKARAFAADAFAFASGHYTAPGAHAACAHAVAANAAESAREATAAVHDPGQAALLRCIIGNPFRPGAVEAAWLAWGGGIVPRLARAAYDHRHSPGGSLDVARLAVLADALEEAGCTDADFLGHLRGPGPHARGCFVVDYLLAKE